LEELLGSLSRKFEALVRRVAAECNADPKVVVTEGVKLFRKRHRLLNGPLAKRIGDEEALERYSLVQSQTGKMTTERLTAEELSKRGRAGAAASARARKKKASAKERVSAQRAPKRSAHIRSETPE
jgi:hypothetical protein